MFILWGDWRQSDVDEATRAMMDAHRRYSAYLVENRDRFAVSAYEFATAAWHHNFNDHRALHDAWVSEFSVRDKSLPADGSDRAVDAELILLGPYHDGHLHLRYRGVHRYRVCRDEVSEGPAEIYRDEVRLSEAGRVLHEIEFLGRGVGQKQLRSYSSGSSNVNTVWPGRER